MNNEVNINTEVDLKREPAFLISAGVLLFLFFAAYWQPIFYVVEHWFHPDYAYAFFVVPFSIYLLWDRRQMLEHAEVRFCAWGIPLMLLGMAMSWYASYHFRIAVNAGTIAITLSGLVLLVGGWQIFRWAWPGVVFLFFIVPLSDHFSIEMRTFLQRVCTQGSVYALQTMGISAVQQGNIIDLPNTTPLNVATACSGLRTLMLFFAACVGAALYVRRNVVIKMIMVCSAFPIAIFCNTIRITLTALMHMTSESAGELTHDLAGLAMMPMAIGILWLELFLIEKLFVSADQEYRPLVGQALGAPASPPNQTEVKE